MLRSHEIDGVHALLIKTIEVGQELVSANEALQRAQEQVKTSTENIVRLRAAFQAFGFENNDELWNEVMQKLGHERYLNAFEAAGAPRPFEPPPSTDDENIDAELANGISSEEKVATERYRRLGAAIDGLLETGEKPEDSDANIRDLVLSYLHMHREGAKARDIRVHLKDKGITMHEKTVGMTLYRLSKENLARRDGRAWYPIQDPLSDGRLGQPSESVFE